MSSMSSPAEMTPRERNDAVLARIRGGPLQPHREGGYVLRVLSTPGRRTGEPRTWPIAVIQWQGEHYVCAPNRRRDWVRNLLAAGWCTVEGEQPDRYEARLVETREAAEAVAAYLGSLQRRSPSSQWPFPRDAPPGQVGQHLSEIAVFQLTPAQ
jgi:deazaflavin-dependent oxidoreductase (nitroreductase family)